MLDMLCTFVIKTFLFQDITPHKNNSIVNFFILTYVLVTENVDGFADRLVIFYDIACTINSSNELLQETSFCMIEECTIDKMVYFWLAELCANPSTFSVTKTYVRIKKFTMELFLKVPTK
jgi:hypothetical protein